MILLIVYSYGRLFYYYFLYLQVLAIKYTKALKILLDFIHTINYTL